MKTKLKIWFKLNHDNYSTVEITVNVSAPAFIEKMFSDHGFWIDREFVPWHNISTIEEL